MPSLLSKFSFCLFLALAGCATQEKGAFTLRMMDAEGRVVETVDAVAMSVTDEENRVDFTDSTGRKRKFIGSFEVYEKAD